MKKKSAFQTMMDWWNSLSPAQQRMVIQIGYTIFHMGKDAGKKLFALLKNVKFPDFESLKNLFNKKASSKSEKIIVSPDFPDDRDPWWRVLKIRPYATEHEVHAAYEKLLAKSHPKKTGKVSARTLKERSQKAARLQQAYDDALESLKQRE